MIHIIERVLFTSFTLVRVACLVAGLALLSSLMASTAGARDLPAWARLVLDGSLVAGAILTTTGVLLVVVARREPRTEPDVSSRGATWPRALAATLLLLAALAFVRSAELVSLWQIVTGLLEQAGFRDELARGGQGSGLVMLPILLALFVPILQSVTTFFLIVVPLLLLAPFSARSARFPTLFSLMAVTQTGLAACSLSASATLGDLARAAMSAMQASEDADVLRAAEVAAQMLGLVDSTSRGFVLPVVGFLLWLPFLLLAREPRRYFVEGAPRPAA